MSLTKVSQNKCFSGWHQQFSHHSTSTNCTMRFAIYLPPQADLHPVPVLYWLSGLTCNDENFMQKAGAMRIAAELGIAIVASDTSPRGERVPDAEDGAYDLGLGAGFYVNATQAPWHEHYQMFDYITKELPSLIEANFPVSDQRAISGHSMGGHGALVIGLSNATRYSSISAFAPICNPSDCPWGEKALSTYLGSNKTNWALYDASKLIETAFIKPPILVDQGSADQFLTEQLKPITLLDAAKNNNYPLTLNMQADYDHSYYFISSFIESHLRFHAEHFRKT